MDPATLVTMWAGLCGTAAVATAVMAVTLWRSGRRRQLTTR
jgi:hypothetical protein